MTKNNPPIKPVIAAKAYLLCTEASLLNIKSINISSQTAKIELLANINAIEMFLDKAKELLTENKDVH